VRILFDQGTPAPLRYDLPGHTIDTAYERGWSRLKNGELIEAAEIEGFDLFVTTDKNLKYQQNLANRIIAIVVLQSTSWPRIRHSLAQVQAAVSNSSPGSYCEVNID
jgi:hypothetical protein